jgi:hypothetical protein
MKWDATSFGFQATLGEGAFILIVFYEHGWKVGVNNRAMKHVYPNPETCKRVAVNWVREKLRVVEAELRELECVK